MQYLHGDSERPRYGERVCLRPHLLQTVHQRARPVSACTSTPILVWENTIRVTLVTERIHLVYWWHNNNYYVHDRSTMNNTKSGCTTQKKGIRFCAPVTAFLIISAVGASSGDPRKLVCPNQKSLILVGAEPTLYMYMSCTVKTDEIWNFTIEPRLWVTSVL